MAGIGGDAAAVGHPLVIRAVARQPGRDHRAYHRVVGSDGALTGYGGGLWRKWWLIEHERRTARADALAGAASAP